VQLERERTKSSRAQSEVITLKQVTVTQQRQSREHKENDDLLFFIASFSLSLPSCVLVFRVLFTLRVINHSSSFSLSVSSHCLLFLSVRFVFAQKLGESSSEALSAPISGVVSKARGVKAAKAAVPSDESKGDARFDVM
jgi:hypothetical protein